MVGKTISPVVDRPIVIQAFQRTILTYDSGERTALTRYSLVMD